MRNPVAKAVRKIRPAVVRELRDFGDAYPTRRGKEADYLEGKHV